NWVNGLQWDWSISRQRYYGIPFPVWYCKKCDEALFARKEELPVNPIVDRPKSACRKCGSTEFIPETDIFDTWQTSSLTPLINAGWKGGDDYSKDIFPMSLRPQAHDIISFWLFTSIVKSYLHTGKLPWKSVLISGHALDPKGNPMHKSLGNTIEPGVMIEKYGADAVRYWAGLSKLGDDASFQEKDVVAGARLVNKLWNAAKFIDSVSERNPKEELANSLDKWIMSRCMLAIKQATQFFEGYNYAGAMRTAEDFLWCFADNYIEAVKYRFYNNDRTASYALRKSFFSIIQMLAPFLPYVTDEIYQNLFKGENSPQSVHLSQWPEYDEKVFDKAAFEDGETIIKVIATARKWKHDNGLPLNAKVSEVIIEGSLASGMADIKGTINADSVSNGKGELEVPGTQLRIAIKK
ncbi:MAG: class I tRNA ligase family protein, partial [Candidatus Micrarchaeaceae archaeon]